MTDHTKELVERLRGSATYAYMPMAVRKLLSEAAEALSLPRPTVDREAIALALVNSDRAMAGLPSVASRSTIPDSDGYLVNADAIRDLLHPIDDITYAGAEPIDNGREG